MVEKEVLERWRENGILKGQGGAYCSPSGRKITTQVWWGRGVGGQAVSGWGGELVPAQWTNIKTWPRTPLGQQYPYCRVAKLGLLQLVEAKLWKCKEIVIGCWCLLGVEQSRVHHTGDWASVCNSKNFVLLFNLIIRVYENTTQLYSTLSDAYVKRWFTFGKCSTHIAIYVRVKVAASWLLAALMSWNMGKNVCVSEWCWTSHQIPAFLWGNTLLTAINYAGPHEHSTTDIFYKAICLFLSNHFVHWSTSFEAPSICPIQIYKAVHTITDYIFYGKKDKCISITFLCIFWIIKVYHHCVV